MLSAPFVVTMRLRITGLVSYDFTGSRPSSGASRTFWGPLLGCQANGL